MKIVCISLLSSLFVFNSFGQSISNSLLEIIPVEEEIIDLSLPEIPWIADDTKTYYNSSPLFSIASADSETAAKGWVSVNKSEINIRVVVTDNYHINTMSKNMIYDGDAIQFGIDANGDGVGNRKKTEAYTGPNDASITFALTNDGPKAWAHYYGHPDGPGQFENLSLEIDRNKRKHTTTYDISLPWESFQMKAGISSYLGMAFQINDTDKGPKQKRIYWGNGAGGNLRPGLFMKLRIAPPNENFISFQTIKNKIWSPTDKTKVIVAIHSDQRVDLSAAYGNLSREVSVTGFKKQGLIYRYRIQTSLSDILHTSDSLFVLIKEEGNESVQSVISVEYLGSVLNNFNELMSNLILFSPHPLYTRNLKSIQAIVVDEWNKAMIRLEEDPYHLQLLAGHMGKILKGFESGIAAWNNPSEGENSLIFAFLSSQDKSLQFYKLSIPEGFDQNKKYPMIIDLHGSGSPYTMDFFKSMFKGGRLSQGKSYIEAIVASPWGRGNNSYRGMAEADVSDVMRDVKYTFNIDDARQYLCGFSMGGYGTWRLAIHSPEHWAAIAICAGGDRGVPAESGLAINIADVPVLIWHGESDGTVPITYAEQMKDALHAVGNTAEMVLVPERGHDFRAEDRVLVYNWLLSKSRNSLTGFSYISYSLASNGRNGVEVLDIFPAATVFPILKLEIIDKLVKINSKNTSRIKVIMGRGGLNLKGDVTIIWNGKEVYNGPASDKVFVVK